MVAPGKARGNDASLFPRLGGAASTSRIHQLAGSADLRIGAGSDREVGATHSETRLTGAHKQRRRRWRGFLASRAPGSRARRRPR